MSRKIVLICATALLPLLSVALAGGAKDFGCSKASVSAQASSKDFGDR